MRISGTPADVVYLAFQDASVQWTRSPQTLACERRAASPHVLFGRSFVCIFNSEGHSIKRYLLALVAALALMLAVAGGASAADHSVPGTPDAANCHGQTMAYFAQLGPSLGIQGGIGNLADAVGASVQQVQAVVDQYCGQ